MNNFFNVNPDAPAVEQNPLAATEFRPNYKKGQGGTFKAVIRFLPNPTDPLSGSIIQKFSAFVTNVATNQQRWVDCPSSIGQPDPIQDTFFMLRKATNPVLVENSKKFSRTARYASLVQVINCESDPTLNGKILVWAYGKKINEKIQAEMNPNNPMIAPRNPFNMLNARPFYVSCKEVSGFNNFDDSIFFDSTTPVYVTVPYNGQLCPVNAETVANADFAQFASNYITENAPSLDPYKYQPWDDETTKFVADAINAAKNPNPVAAPAASQYGSAFANPTAPAAQPMTMPGMPGFGGMPGAAPAPGQSVPGMGMPSMGAGVPTGMPSGMPSMTMPGAAPAAQPAAMPQTTASTQPAPTPGATTPGGFSASNIPNVDDIMNIGANPAPSAAAQPAAAPSGGININDVLGEIM